MLISPPLLQDIPGLACAFTQRQGGISQGPFASLNLKFPVTDQDEPAGDAHVWHNRQQVCQQLGLSAERLVACQQVHGDLVYHVTSADAGRGARGHEQGIPETDGLFTHEVDIPLLIMVADCYPVVLVDPVQHVIAAVHSGWRGTEQKIAVLALKHMVQQYQTQAQDVRCVIGTGIDFHSFEVGAEVVEAFQGQIDLSNPERVKAIGAKYRLNLPGILQDQLIAAGVLSTHIEVLGGDTLTDENYFSYRRQQGITGRQGVIVGWTS